MNELTVYVLTNAKGTPFYVGETGNPERRVAMHRTRFGDAFRFVVVSRCSTRAEALQQERAEIARLRAVGVPLYNTAFNEGPGGPAPLEDWDVPPTFSACFYRLLAELAKETGLSPERVALNAVRHYRRKLEQRSTTATVPDVDGPSVQKVFRQMQSKASKDWWKKLPPEERRARALKAVAGRKKRG